MPTASQSRPRSRSDPPSRSSPSGPPSRSPRAPRVSGRRQRPTRPRRRPRIRRTSCCPEHRGALRPAVVIPWLGPPVRRSEERFRGLGGTRGPGIRARGRAVEQPVTVASRPGARETRSVVTRVATAGLNRRPTGHPPRARPHTAAGAAGDEPRHCLRGPTQPERARLTQPGGRVLSFFGRRGCSSAVRPCAPT